MASSRVWTSVVGIFCWGKKTHSFRESTSHAQDTAVSRRANTVYRNLGWNTTPAELLARHFGVLIDSKDTDWHANMYSTNDFATANKKDVFPPGVGELTRKSKNVVLKWIGSIINMKPKGKAEGKTVSFNFCLAIGDIKKKIEEASPHFIRCINPNASQKGLLFECPKVLQQLTCAGIVEAARIRRWGFPLRIPFDEFLSKYQACLPSDWKDKVKAKCQLGVNPKRAKIRCILDEVPTLLEDKTLLEELPTEPYFTGKTKLFSKRHGQVALDQALRFARANRCTTIQRFYRGYAVSACPVICCNISEVIHPTPKLPGFLFLRELRVVCPSDAG